MSMQTLPSTHNALPHSLLLRKRKNPSANTFHHSGIPQAHTFNPRRQILGPIRAVVDGDFGRDAFAAHLFDRYAGCECV